LDYYPYYDPYVTCSFPSPPQPDIPANSKVLEMKHLMVHYVPTVMIKPYMSVPTNLPVGKKEYLFNGIVKHSQWQGTSFSDLPNCFTNIP
jgi:hypothetical protein